MSNYSNPALSHGLPSTRVLADAIPGDRVRDALLILGGAGLTALGGQISINVAHSPVPVTGQTLGVVLAGSTLGMWRGAASQILFLVLGLFPADLTPPALLVVTLFGARPVDTSSDSSSRPRWSAGPLNTVGTVAGCWHL